ncbi:MAG: phosphodiester glycosidase family protein [Nostocaceae cyanobacterium]|nr:phosphodiester glycosidase family protein [Nostocaceae cyanobacterium]
MFNKFLNLSLILMITSFTVYGCRDSENFLAETPLSINESQKPETPKQNKLTKKKGNNCLNNSIKFFKTNNKGQTQDQGQNHVIIFDPKSPELNFKVSMGLAHKLYAKSANGKYRKEYVPKQFNEIISDENSKLNGKSPFAAINGDYIDPENKPQGLNISLGIEYSGAFKNKRSSFGISGGSSGRRRATIGKGRRANSNLNYNVVGGNGRFYENGQFKNICRQLGEDACRNETSRSMVAITSKGYVILLVNNAYGDLALYPDEFDNVLEGIAKNYCLGSIQEGMLFDGGNSTALYYDGQIHVQNINPIGSVFLIYKK